MIKHWIQAARLRTLPLAIANVCMGASVAAYFGSFNFLILLMTIATAVLLQILSNFANEYGDYVHGADHAERLGPNRTVQSGTISPESMKNAMIAIGLLSVISGCYLISLTLLPIGVKLLFILLGLMAVWAAINYTAGDKPYGYSGWGDLSVFVFFGLLSVLGSYYLQSSDWNWTVLLPAISCGSFSMAVLNINNIRDIQSDKLAGKRSLVVKMGRKNAVLYHMSLLTVGLMSSVIFTLMYFDNWLQFLFLIITPLLLVNYRAVLSKTAPMELDPYLKQMALTTLLFVITFSIGFLL